MTIFLMTLLSIDWLSCPLSLIEAAVEVTGSLADVFDEYLTSNHIEILSKIFSLLLSFDTFGSGKEMSAVSAGRAFPHGFSDRILYKLSQDRIHLKLLNLLTLYINMSEVQLSNVLGAVLCFIDYEPSLASDCIQDSNHFMILFASQHFAGSKSIQKPLWILLARLIEYAPALVKDLGPEMVAPVLESVASAQLKSNGTIDPMCFFLTIYMLKTGPALVEYCFKEDQQLIHTLLKVLQKPIDPLKCKETHEDLSIAAKMLGIFCSVKTSLSTINEVVALGIIPQLANAAVICPQCCCSTYCKTLGEVLSSLPPDISNIPPSLRAGFLAKIPSDILELKSSFFSQNHLLPFHTFLKASLPPEKRELIYMTIKQLLRLTPEDVSSTWLTKEFLEIYVPAFRRDVENEKGNSFHLFVFVTHFITYSIKSKELVQVLSDLKLHEVAVSVCLKRANYRDARVTTLNFINCLLRTYQEFLASIEGFARGEFPDLLIQLALTHGRRQKSEIGEQFGTLVLGLTADKNASNILYERGILQQFYSLVDKQFDPNIVRNAIHSVGNIALAGHAVKQVILSHKFHKTVIAFIDQEMNQFDANALSACCRVLHILCSGDWAKREFAEEGLVGILIRLLRCRNDTAELCWRPLGLLSSICFMSLCNRQYLVSEGVLMDLIELMKGFVDMKVISYFALVFLACSDMDRHLTKLRQFGVIDRFHEILEKDSLTVSSDLKRWGSSLIEKGNLFTITIQTEGNEYLLSSFSDSLIWPPSYSLFSYSNDTTLLSDIESQLSPRFPEGTSLNEEQLKLLGLTPDHTLFRISRVYGSTHGLCSNCEKEGPSEELVFRPHNLTPTQYQVLIMRGWYRRGGVKFFRYRYNHNLECSDWETRVHLSQFDHKKRKSYRKVLRKMPEDRLTVETIPTQFVQEAYDLYNSYHFLKHDKPRKSRYSYCEHVVNSPLRNQTIDGMAYGTFHQLYRIDGKLIAVGVIDVVPNGVVSIYMWYGMSKDVTKLSPGVYSALKEIQYAQELSKLNSNICYYYLQGWNGNNHKLAYKGNYEPEDFYSPCTVVEWVHGLDGIKEAREDYCRTHAKDQVDGLMVESVEATSSKSEASGKEVVSGVALPLDRMWYKKCTGQDSVDMSKLVVCLNGVSCMYLSEVMVKYGLSAEQCQMMRVWFVELVLALGPQLSSNMIIDLKVCP